ncbi:hypothetical protein JCM19039_3288 [Geomicrobium sp. JCM 19039]|nr:hypothetical protein JCM19039_3288 [Geomicrobium sp. JCM 19039]
MLEEGLAQLIQRGYGDPIVIGHSTGGGIASNYLWNDERRFRIKKLILVAPLARTKGWFTTKVGSVFINLFSDDVHGSFERTQGMKGLLISNGRTLYKKIEFL